MTAFDGTAARPLTVLADDEGPDGRALSATDFACRNLGVGRSELVSASTFMDNLSRRLLGYTLKLEADRSDDVTLGPSIKRQAPNWELLELSDRTVLIPTGASLGFPAGALAPVPVVARLVDDWRNRFEVVTRLADAEWAHRILEDLVERSQGETNPFRGQVLQAGADQGSLSLRVVDPPDADRATLLLEDHVWETIDRNVHRVIERADELVEAGLAADRGLLLAGPPGTGKTALSRVVAAELAGQATVVLCNIDAARSCLPELYSILRHVAPALVVIEDLDLIAANRHQGYGDGLQQFLVALDGVSSTGACIITLASTNDPGALDEAAKRAARIDITIDLPAPKAPVRARIVASYLERIDHDVDADRIAAATSGWSGAELRELVRRAVIERDDRVVTEDLLRLLREKDPADSPGLYL